MATEKLKPADLKKLKKQLSDVNRFIKEIQKMGGKIPKELVKALGVLEKAIDTGIKLGEAIGDAQKAVKKYEKDLMGACKTVAADQKMACEAGVFHKYQWRSVQFTLSPKNPESVFSKFIDKIAKGILPSSVCKHWDYCKKTSLKAK